VPAELIATKLKVPLVRRETVARPRLFEMLDAGLSRKLTLVSASAGCGKTTLLAEWVQGCELPVAWLSLDEGDDDPARFGAYLGAALSEALDHQADGSQAPGMGGTGLRLCLAQWVNQIASQQGELVLILDDYHLIQAREIHAAMTWLLEHQPDSMHIYVATRADPAFPLARLRAQDEMVEVRVPDLRFDPLEAGAFLNGVMGLDLSPGGVSEMNLRTEGWVTGLQLAALSMRHAADRERFIETFAGSDAYVADFLVEQVLQGLSQEMRSFMLETSILRRLCAPLCEAVTESAGGQGTLEHLQAANLFLSPLDQARRWFAYHRLFADLLRQRLMLECPQRLAALHARAAHWHLSEGDPRDAIPHLFQAKDMVGAADAIQQIADDLLMRSETTTLFGWLQRLPQGVIEGRPALRLARAWAGFLSRFEVVGIQDDLAALAESEPSRCLALKAYVSLLAGRVVRAREQARRALDTLPPEESFSKSVAGWVLEAAGIMEGDLQSSESAFAELIQDARLRASPLLLAISLCNLAEIRARQGCLPEAARIYRRAESVAVDAYGHPLPIAGMALLGLADVFREWNELDRAEALLARGQQLLLGWTATGATDGLMTQARIRLERGDQEGAQEAMRQARETARQTSITDWDDWIADLFTARIQVALGNPASAREHLGAAGLDSQENPPSVRGEMPSMDYHVRHHQLLTLARILMAERDPQGALALLDQLLEGIERHGWRPSRREMEVQMLRAMALDALGQTRAAQVALGLALRQAEPGGYVRSFIDEGPHMRRLLKRAQFPGVSQAYVAKLLAAFPQSAPQGLVEPLSERELEVLRLIAKGYSNRQIADELIVAVGTVKAHSASIYGKLGVSNRVQAVAVANQHHLL